MQRWRCRYRQLGKYSGNHLQFAIITVYLRILLPENNNKMYIKYTLDNMVIKFQAAHSYPKRMYLLVDNINLHNIY